MSQLSCALRAGLSFLAAFSWGPVTAAAGEAEAKASASIVAGFTTDYVYRGISLNGERPTGLLNLDATWGPVFFNGLVIGTDLGEDGLGRDIGTIEADATVGLKQSLGDAEVSLGVKYTGYPNGRDLVNGTLERRERDFIEFFLGGTFNLTPTASIGGYAYWTPDFYYESGQVTTLELKGALALPEVLGIGSRLTSTVGQVRSDARDFVIPGNGYVYCNAGIEGRVDRIMFDLRYWATDVKGIDGFENRIALTIGMLFD